eukprot:CAMPEP_0171216684 /NCGR_PEP_ID=MMETSP0790-20130122/32305_1 /TAXON_ID=2925 /ORGANISM="Alexandrium catenella, Strain OF101" /LENGTH=134 /DNA_ID=CAMNT_0011682467 /DNA_START=131 /DNA_END=531 /DNA_ORIENTATION=-
MPDKSKSGTVVPLSSLCSMMLMLTSTTVSTAERSEPNKDHLESLSRGLWQGEEPTDSLATDSTSSLGLMPRRVVEAMLVVPMSAAAAGSPRASGLTQQQDPTHKHLPSNMAHCLARAMLRTLSRQVALRPAVCR